MGRLSGWWPRRRGLPIVVAAAVLAGGWVTSEARAATPGPAADPASLVDTFVGTGAATVPGENPGAIDMFPGADVPFGMVQWSPDTPSRPSGGGYNYDDHAISGFSLTHLSGEGCPAFGDVPILPTVGAISATPDVTTATFAHNNESASPGRYDVTLTNPRIGVELTTTTRSGLARFSFPATSQANLLIKADGSASGVDANNVSVVGTNEVDGSVTSGHFCSTVGTYTLYFALEFDRPFSTFGTWDGTTNLPGSGTCAAASTSGAVAALEGSNAPSGGGCGAWVSFDTTSDRQVLARVGVSFTSVAEARANVAAEDTGWDLSTIEARATQAWNHLLSRITVTGGSDEDRRVLYTALYHSLLQPTVFSDADGSYIGFDHLVHQATDRIQYTNFSEWDIYRSEIPLLALVAPHQTSDMMQSLVADAAQGGRLPKWATANTDSAQMNGDSADPVLADAYAWGATDFDVGAALADMIRGATLPGPGITGYPERQNLVEYLMRGWVHREAEDITSLGYTVGGSETLEYAIDDFAISRLALALGDSGDASAFLERSANWRNLFNPATGWLGARDGAGNFQAGAAFQVSSTPSLGQDGWEEGNSIQYSWSVPQDLGGLVAAMGGDKVVQARLDNFFGQLNAGRREPYDWAGNEPSLGSPWVYDYAGAPWKTADVVRRISLGLYALDPDGEPGNDDLGAMASWEVWADIGLYPETPGVANLVMGSPVFSSVSIDLPSGAHLVVEAPGASDAARYVQGARLSFGSGGAAAASWSRPWLPASVLKSGATLDLTVAATPDKAWGAAPADAPPSF